MSLYSPPHPAPAHTGQNDSLRTARSVPSRETLMNIVQRPQAVMVRGEGSWLWDEHGTRYLDFIQGWAVNALGHCAREITAALLAQAQTLVTPSPALHNLPQLELAELLLQTTGNGQVHFANSGAEANEAAVKLARKWGQLNRGGANRILTTHQAFHGRTMAMMAASGKPGWDTMFAPPMPGFGKVAYGDPDAMEQAIDSDTVAIMVEPVQGEAGVIVPPDGYLRALRDIADRHNLLLILDEVQTGVGRTGTFLCCEHESVAADIITLGKGLGGGVPISAVLARERALCFEPGDQGGTYNGNPLMCAVALAVVQIVRDPAFLERVASQGIYLREQLQSLAATRNLQNVRGVGLLCAVDTGVRDAPGIARRAADRGLLVNAPQPHTIRFMPSLRVSRGEIDCALQQLDEVLAR